MNRLEVVTNPNWLKKWVCCCRDKHSRIHRKLVRAVIKEVLVLSCNRCLTPIARLNPRTCKVELLHGESPWILSNAASRALSGQEEGGKGNSRHPEDTCEDCGRDNVTWFTPSPIWNSVMRKNGQREPMVCPVCFIKRAASKGVTPTAWVLKPETHNG